MPKPTPGKKKSTTPTPTPTPVVAAAKPTSTLPPTFATQYAHWKPLLAKLPSSTLVHFANDAQVVLTNVRSAIKNLRPHEPTLRADTTIDWNAVFELESLTEGFVFASLNTEPTEGPTREEIDARRAELQKLREPGLLFARGLALLGLMPMERVEKIEAGTGLVDIGQDGIALPKLFRDYEADIEGMHPMNAARLATMENLGEWILRNVDPDGTATETAPDPARVTATEVVDRFWTEIQRRHRDAETGGFKVWNKDYSRYVPPLLSRAAPPRKKPDEAEKPVQPT